ncbi:hypothetical protein AKJ43_02875 [candidate division MSBL1 archaeon SCGC-AAA261D19]|uniref:Glycosyl transferase family 1 n=1 Tax=candidate division MSBL1 archaeon SCGC-AAA261D19 TaxID=1698273 RepID=A0A133V638_9EURY|nr:hypothetical protein AKJ43_02875 [candidate division MSBL1 archaeon SCGC-AAA261D19]
MKIALVTDTYHPQVNGVVSSVDTIAGELKKKHETYLFAPTKAEFAHSFRSFPFYLYPDYRIAFTRPKTLAKIFERNGIEIVHVHTPFSLGASAVGAARHLSLPTVGTFHTLLPEYTHYVSETLELLLRRAVWRYITWFYGRFNAVTVPSTPIKDILVERGLKNVYVIPNAVDVNLFCPGKESPSGDPCVLFVGRLGKEKRLEVLIDAAPNVLEEYPKTKFRIIGKGIHEKWYKKLVKEKNISNNFVFEGHVRFSDLIKSYRECDVFAIPSDTETQGLVILEAMACEKPVVGADARGVKDLITHGVDGYLFQPGNSSELSDYLLSLLEDDKRRRKMGKGAREKAKKFSAERIGNRWANFYSSLLG